MSSVGRTARSYQLRGEGAPVVKASCDILTIGEALVLFREDDVQELAVGKTFTTGIGGAESNVAISMQRLGFSASWIGAIGNDAFGNLIESTLRAEGVTTVLRRDHAHPTGHMIKLSSGAGDPLVVYCRKNSAASHLSPDQVAWGYVPETRLLHLSGVFLALSEETRATALQLAEKAIENKIPVSFDINYRHQLWDPEMARLHLKPFAELAQYVFGGESEFSILAGGKDYSDELVETFAGSGDKEVVVKRGPAGASVFCDGRWLDVEPHAVSVVDTVGAGDAFVAGYLSQKLSGQSIDTCLAAANFCGARACENRGDWEGNASLADLKLGPFHTSRARG